jgi:hypothetical protein
MNIKDLVKDKTAKFVSYREGNFYYETSDGFKFVVPIEEAAGVTLPAQDKAIFFMRWIRKQLENNGN